MHTHRLSSASPPLPVCLSRDWVKKAVAPWGVLAPSFAPGALGYLSRVA